MTIEQVLAAPRALRRGVIEIGNSANRGRGVFATQHIAKRQLIERCPVLIIPSRDRLKADATIVFTYVFMWEHDTIEEDLYRHDGRAAIALGYTSLLNHSAAPNCTFTRHIDELVIDLNAARDIAEGEELTIDYQMTLWFDPV